MPSPTIVGIVGTAHHELCCTWTPPLSKQQASEEEQKQLRHNETKQLLRRLFALDDVRTEARVTLLFLRCLGVVATPDLTETVLDIAPRELAAAVDALPSVERCCCREIPLTDSVSVMALADYM